MSATFFPAWQQGSHPRGTKSHNNRVGCENPFRRPRRTREPHHQDDRDAGYEPRPTPLPARTMGLSMKSRADCATIRGVPRSKAFPKRIVAVLRTISVAVVLIAMAVGCRR